MTYKKLSDLRPYDKNPRSISKEGYERLKKQIIELGQYKPLVITQDGEVLGGNMRLKAYQELGIEDIWVSIVDVKTDEEKLRYNFSDNDRAGFYDKDLLANLIPDFPNFKWEDFSIDLKEPTNLQDLLDQFKETVEDEVPEVSQEPAVSQVGEVYQLGRHRLMCGDSTKTEDVEKLMDGQKADMVFTDPPYGVNYEGKTKDKLKIENDINTDIFKPALVNMIAVSKGGASYYVCCPPGNNFKDFLVPFSELLYESSTIIWAKNSMVLGHGDYHYQHEPILYGWNKSGTHQFYGDRTNTTLWQIDRPSRSKEHPTMKPIKLVSRAISNSSKSDDIVLDLFGGSGSTLIACEQTNRTCYMMELDPKYVDVIRKRYAKFINKETEWQTITPVINS